MSTDVPLLRMQGISKAFPGVQALQGVDFEVAHGEIHALVGENGAGKSTLMKILTGALRPDSGQIFLRGQPVEIPSPRAAQALGISMIHQELSLIPYLTVGQNIFLGREPRRGRLGLVDWPRLYRQAQALLDRLNVGVDARAEVRDLSIAQQQMVEVAKALALNAEPGRGFGATLIAMDEPTSTLTERETEVLFDLMRSLKAAGVSLIFISHRLEEIFRIADRLTVLRDGCLVGVRAAAEVDADDVVRMMVGRQLSEMYPRTDAVRGGPMLEVRNLQDGRELHGASLTVHSGEIVGVAGLVGAGRTALAETVFGVRRATAGEVRLAGRPLRLRGPGDAIRQGMGFVPEDRKGQGLFLNMAVRENIAISSLKRLSRLGFLRFAAADRLAGEFVRRLAIRTPSLRQRVRNLSGGNQQKVIIARWLALNPKVLILDEPTRGVDVGAKAEIHGLMNQLVAQGVAVLMISSELPEVLGVSDRILVMRAGRIVAEFSRAEATEDAIMRAATGAGGNGGATSP